MLLHTGERRGVSPPVWGVVVVAGELNAATAMKTYDSCVQDVMQVCRNGHVITDLLQSYPERGLAHCDRCGATTIDRCLTCGQVILGATFVPGLLPVGTLAAPKCCASCGASFPWSERKPAAPPHNALLTLESLLRRVPRVIRQLRTRHGNRPPFRVQDAHDLEDLLRALLALQFDEVRPESRTPGYAFCTRTDFRIGQEEGSYPIALTAKIMGPGVGENALLEQWREDVRYYARIRGCSTLVAFVYDPEGLVRDPQQVQAIWTSGTEEVDLRCIFAT
jgi:hypothetical protein